MDNKNTDGSKTGDNTNSSVEDKTQILEPAIAQTEQTPTENQQINSIFSSPEQDPNKKEWYKKWWIWVIVCIAVVAIVVCCIFAFTNKTSNDADSNTNSNENSTTSSDEADPEKETEPSKTAKPKPTDSIKNNGSNSDSLGSDKKRAIKLLAQITAKMESLQCVGEENCDVVNGTEGEFKDLTKQLLNKSAELQDLDMDSDNMEEESKKSIGLMEELLAIMNDMDSRIS